jgi:hypothetical protein
MNDARRRKKALNEFKDSIEELLEKFSDAGESVHELYLLIRYLEKMDTNSISDNISSINANKHVPVPDKSTGEPSGNGNSGNGNSGNNYTTSNLSIDELASALTSAIRNALDNATVTKSNRIEPDSASPFADVINAIQSGYKIDLM